MVGKELPALYTPDEAAEYLYVHKNTLCRWRQEGRGPRFTRVGRFIMYTRESLDAYVQERTTETRSK